MNKIVLYLHKINMGYTLGMFAYQVLTTNNEYNLVKRADKNYLKNIIVYYGESQINILLKIKNKMSDVGIMLYMSFYSEHHTLRIAHHDR